MKEMGLMVKWLIPRDQESIPEKKSTLKSC